MAKVELRFLSNDDDFIFIKCESDKQQIVIETMDISTGDNLTICLDIPTAIKFAKTLRTEINKAKEVNNG